MPQQQLDYRSSLLGQHVPWHRKPVYWLLFCLPTLPLLIFILPHALTLMPEPTDPWYTRYTTPTALLVSLYVFPATAVCLAVGVKPISPVWFMVVLMYTGLIGWGLCSLVSRRRAAA